jgi:hypothetical protein
MKGQQAKREAPGEASLQLPMPARPCKQAVLRQNKSMCCVYLIETVWFEDPAVHVQRKADSSLPL